MPAVRTILAGWMPKPAPGFAIAFKLMLEDIPLRNDERRQVLNMPVLMQVNANDEYPVHQADKIVRMEV